VVSCFGLGGATRRTHSPRVKIGQYQLSLEDGGCRTAEAHRIRHGIEWNKDLRLGRFLYGPGMYDRPLASFGETDRLTIHARGSETHRSEALLYEPRQLAQMLHQAGLRQMGILIDNRIPVQVCGVEFTINNNLGRGLAPRNRIPWPAHALACRD